MFVFLIELNPFPFHFSSLRMRTFLVGLEWLNDFSFNFSANHLTRKQWNEESLFRMPPNQEETKIIHQLFLQTVDPK